MNKESKNDYMEKKLYVQITSGEESYYFTQQEGLRLLSEEFYRVQREGREDELGYEWAFEWLTEEEYKEMQSSDKPTWNSPAVDEKMLVEKAEELWDKHSEIVEDNSFGFERVAGNSMMSESQYKKAVAELIIEAIHP